MNKEKDDTLVMKRESEVVANETQITSNKPTKQETMHLMLAAADRFASDFGCFHDQITTNNLENIKKLGLWKGLLLSDYLVCYKELVEDASLDEEKMAENAFELFANCFFYQNFYAHFDNLKCINLLKNTIANENTKNQFEFNEPLHLKAKEEITKRKKAAEIKNARAYAARHQTEFDELLIACRKLAVYWLKNGFQPLITASLWDVQDSSAWPSFLNSDFYRLYNQIILPISLTDTKKPGEAFKLFCASFNTDYKTDLVSYDERNFVLFFNEKTNRLYEGVEFDYTPPQEEQTKAIHGAPAIKEITSDVIDDFDVIITDDNSESENTVSEQDIEMPQGILLLEYPVNKMEIETAPIISDPIITKITAETSQLPLPVELSENKMEVETQKSEQITKAPAKPPKKAPITLLTPEQPPVNELKDPILQGIKKIVDALSNYENGRQKWYTVGHKEKLQRFERVRTWVQTNPITEVNKLLVLALIRDISAVKRNKLGLFPPHSYVDFEKAFESELKSIPDEAFTKDELNSLDQDSYDVDVLLNRHLNFVKTNYSSISTGLSEIKVS